MPEGGLVRRGRRTPLLFGPEAMRLSKVHGAGVLRMKPAAYSYRQLMSGCRRVRYPLTSDALSLFHDVRSLLPRKEASACPPLEEFGAVSACDQ